MAVSILPPASVRLTDVSVDYSGNPLFDNLNLTIAAGKTTCILGPSGCGKSTLLKLIASNPDIEYSGTITFSPPDQEVSWMGQNDLLLPWMTLHDNVMLGARLRGEVSRSTEEKASVLLRSAGLAKYELALPAQLSGGMRQRGALLRTLMEERSLLLMDEPFSALDALTRLKLQDLTVSMTRDKTVLLVTHDPLEALRMGNEIIIFSGTPADVEIISDLPGKVPRHAAAPDTARLHDSLLRKLMRENHESR
ncbi:MAG: ABC transporter ATP-binding protein [Desulfocapsaceae bacterium]|nr:ABC transporter ATP-binding protein [Desulfocapsaceae bacterium]